MSQNYDRVTTQTRKEWLEDWLKRDHYYKLLEGNTTNEFKDSGENEMKVKDTGTNIDFEPAPTGTHIARCVRIIDLGTAMDDFWQREKHELFFMWELPHEMKTFTNAENVEVTEPFTVSKFYTASLSDKAHLRNDLEAWRSKPFTEQELEGFDTKAILGAPCMANIIHSPKKKGSGINVIVKSVTSMPKNLECPPAAHPLVYFSLDVEDFDEKVFDELSKGIKARVMKSNEYKAITGRVDSHQPDKGQGYAPPQEETEFDDIPF